MTVQTTTPRATVAPRLRLRLRLRRRARRWWLFAHVVSSVGWIGVELSILALGVVA